MNAALTCTQKMKHEKKNMKQTFVERDKQFTKYWAKFIDKFLYCFIR